MSKTTINYLIIFLFLFCIGYNSFFDTLGYMTIQKLLLLFTIVFIAFNNQWKQFGSYFNLQKIEKSNRKLIGSFLVLAISIQVLGIGLAKHFDKSLFNQYQNPPPFWISPLLEETFYVGVVLHTLWQPFRNLILETKNKTNYTILVPVLIIFYWIIQSRSFYDTVFLDTSISVSNRILDFPGATFLGFLLSAIAFSKTRSLIPSLLIHYSMNTVVWLWFRV